MTGFMQMVITEKIDGTNAQINITPGPNGDFILRAGSKNRFLTPDNDNFGFARWCLDNREELIAGLGEGRHFGEWAGPGIQKNKMNLGHKTLFLFNVTRWHEENPNPLPCGIHTVPILYKGAYDTVMIDRVMAALLDFGSELPANLSLEGPNDGGRKDPEGIVIYLPKSGQLFKRTFKYEAGKWSKE